MQRPWFFYLRQLRALSNVHFVTSIQNCLCAFCLIIYEVQTNRRSGSVANPCRE